MAATNHANAQAELPVHDRQAKAAPQSESLTKQDPHRLIAIDAIRGIAAISVVVGHSLEEFLRQLPDNLRLGQILSTILIEYINLGRMGVVAFFCVSGYVIPFSFAKQKPLRSFLIARFFRLYPAYWASLLTALIITWILQGSLPPLPTIFANLTMVQALFRRPDILGVYWTLFYELAFYGLCVIAFIWKKLESPFYLLTAVSLLSAIGMAAALMRHTGTFTAIPIGLFMFLAIMHLGTLARIADRNDNPMARKVFWIALSIVLLTAGPISGLGFIQHASDERLMADVTSIYMGLAAFAMLRRSKHVANSGTMFLGKISYSLYLFHPLCLLLAAALGKSLEKPWGAIVVITAIPTTSLLLATLGQRFIEAPANRVGRAVRRKAVGG